MAAEHAVAGAKRKRTPIDTNSNSKSTVTQSQYSNGKLNGNGPRPSAGSRKADISSLETKIAESRKHYNELITLIDIARREDRTDGTDTAASVALCRTFCRLIANGSLTEPKSVEDAETVIFGWLKERYGEYRQLMIDNLRDGDSSQQYEALTLLLRLVKAEISHHKSEQGRFWRSGTFATIVQTLLAPSKLDNALEEFTRSYLNVYRDVRFYTFSVVA